MTRDRGASNSHRRRFRCSCNACSFQWEIHTMSPSQMIRLRPMARIANTITGPQAVSASGLSGRQPVEDLSDEYPE